MIEPSPHPREEDRLKALNELSILDSLPEQVYDDIVLLASKICKTPIALISLVDRERQWFKAKIGVDAEETGRSESFCAHSIVGKDGYLVVPNVKQDERFHDNPLVDGAPHIRFYAGVNLETQENLGLGTLCVIDRNPRELPAEDLEALQALARQIEAHFMARLELEKSQRAEREKEAALTALQQTNGELVEARIAAELATRAKSEFLANISHEIRTPMNAILGFADLMRHETLDPKHKQYLNAIASSGNALLHLINEILDLSKIEAGRMSLELAPTDLKQLINDVSHTFELKSYEKGLRLLVDLPNDLPPRLSLDELRLRQVLFNLVGNALKFTSSGEVEIRVEATPGPTSAKLAISIRDTGIGIPEAEQQRIFEPFVQQSGQSTRTYGGTGLGLAITKRLVELMGGTISVRSKVGEGSTIQIELPEVEIPATEESTACEGLLLEPGESMQFQPAKVLLVEDNPTNRDLIRAYLAGSGLELIEAENGEKGIEVATRVKPNLILMDIAMPVMDGHEAIHRLRENPETAHIPVLVVTASIKSSDPESIGAGWDGCLLKPVKREVLLTELVRFLPTVDASPEEAVGLTETPSDSKASSDSLRPLLDELNARCVQEAGNCAKRIRMGRVKEFSDQLRLLSETYPATTITEFVGRLDAAIKSTNVLRIQAILRELPELVAALEQKAR